MEDHNQDQNQDHNQDQEYKDNQNNKEDKDKMHPDDIAGLAQENQATQENQENQEDKQKLELTQDNQDQEEDQEEEQESEIEIDFKTDNETDKEPEPEDPPFDHLIRTRSGRVLRPVHKYVTTHQAHLQTQAIEQTEYLIEMAKVIAQTISKMNYQFAQTYSLIKGIKAFGDKGHQAAHNEMKQLHDRIVFKPILIEELTTIEQKCAMESLIFLTDKKDSKIKARTCANGSTQREYIKHDEAASPTAMTKSHLITADIDAKQGCNIMTADIPNAFVQTNIEKKPRGQRIVMKIRG